MGLIVSVASTALPMTVPVATEGDVVDEAGPCGAIRRPEGSGSPDSSDCERGMAEGNVIWIETDSICPDDSRNVSIAGSRTAASAWSMLGASIATSSSAAV